MRTAIVCIAKNEDRYIKEWAEYHLKLGFDSIYIYQNDWRTDLEIKNVKKRIADGPVQQIKVYNSFLQENIGLSDSDYNKYDWVAFIDVDEFIVLSKHSSIHQFIKWMLSAYGPTDSISLYWAFFGDNGIKEDDESEGVLRRFTKRGHSNRHFKSIINGKIKGMCDMWVHGSNRPSIDTWGNKPVCMSYSNIAGSYPIDIARINHYFTKTKKEFEKKVLRGRADVTYKRSATQEEFDKHQKNYNLFDDFEARDFMYPPNNDTV